MGLRPGGPPRGGPPGDRRLAGLSGVLFVRHSSTPGMRAARFPAPGEDADAASLTRAAALTRTPTGPVAASAAGPGAVAAPGSAAGAALGSAAGAVARVAPSVAARQTVDALGLAARVVPALAEVDCGRWRGLPYERVAREEPDALASWLTDPHAAPHGGESLAAHAERVAAWLESVRAEPGVVAVCDAGTIRAALGHALGLDPLSAARFDLAPLSVTELTVTRAGWRVAHVNRKVLI
ncbi:histidine phosphatase family protein [Nonomuraea angiospora]|uniref:histidine phosphatase family protein n=1 Tax=Nonomuraea angiospora TaxID=46172 RepID=UPI0029A723F4|nr:histidine phosphatase family protein [Nonomuraea angiospora]MDX3109308.1 histidine phosphatase family protein [Nonomuraea angiospora]